MKLSKLLLFKLAKELTAGLEKIKQQSSGVATDMNYALQIYN